MVFILPGQNKRQKNKRKRNRKGKGPQAFSPTNPPEPTSLAQPADSSVVFLHLLAVEHAEPRRGHRDGQAVHASSPSLSPRQGNPLEAPRQFPLSLDLLPLSSSPLPCVPRSSPERASTQPWPTAPSRQAVVSSEAPTVVFVKPCLQFAPSPPTTRPFSTSRRRPPRDLDEEFAAACTSTPPSSAPSFSPVHGEKNPLSMSLIRTPSVTHHESR